MHQLFLSLKKERTSYYKYCKCELEFILKLAGNKKTRDII
jgi:hypothetical protein